MLRRARRITVLAIGLSLAGVTAAAADTLVDNDRMAGSYTRYDGGTDATLQGCSTGRRSQNEPSVAVDPRSSDVVVAGSNDYCAEIGSGSGNQWPGYYRSTNGGATWRSSLVPGYPGDTSPLGSQSPTKGSCASAGDPTQAFDGDGRLYYGFICFNRAKPTNGSIYVARYDDDGATYRFTTRVERGTPVGRRAIPGQDQHHRRPAQRQRLRRMGALQRQSRQRRDPVLALDRRRADVLQADPDLRRRGLRAVRRPRGRARRRRLPDVPHLRRLAGARLDRDRQVDERRASRGRARAPSRRSPASTRPTTARTPAATARSAARCSTMRASRACRRSPPTPTACTSSGTGARAPASPQVFARNSSDGLTWTGPIVRPAPAATGHQFFPDIATDGSTLSVILQDSRADPAYSPDRPMGNTAAGTSSGPSSTPYLARSANGLAWTPALVSTARSNPNFENRGSARSPFFGDYNYVSAAPDGSFFTVWTDTRDLVSVHRPARRQPGRGLRRGHPDLQLGAGRHLRGGLQLPAGVGPVPVAGRPRPEHLRRRGVAGHAGSRAAKSDPAQRGRTSS